MPEHFNKQTVEATFRCAKCNKDAPHFVWDGRRGACKVCLAKLENSAPAKAKPEQGFLF
jgi:hypothetical protein